MADITISDLELAPALTDDMVLPVENTTDTYAATLAMLRRLINKTFVEVENADFNALTDDGFYQCTGTTTNSPVAGAINWTLQVSAENGVVVQRAFSLDDNFANLYIRRWNGVTWTGWLEVGAGAINQKANISLNNIDATGQAKFDAKADKNISVIGIPATSGTVTLADNTVYTGTMTGAMTFVLPTVTDATKYHQIKAMLYLPAVTINWGTSHYIGGEAPDVSEAGNYMIYWDYVPALSAWAVGAMKVG